MYPEERKGRGHFLRGRLRRQGGGNSSLPLVENERSPRPEKML